MMLRMSVHFEKENKINNKVKSAMTYPAILSVVAVGGSHVYYDFCNANLC